MSSVDQIPERDVPLVNEYASNARIIKNAPGKCCIETLNEVKNFSSRYCGIIEGGGLQMPPSLELSVEGLINRRKNRGVAK